MRSYSYSQIHTEYMTSMSSRDSRHRMMSYVCILRTHSRKILRVSLHDSSSLMEREMEYYRRKISNSIRKNGIECFLEFETRYTESVLHFGRLKAEKRNGKKSLTILCEHAREPISLQKHAHMYNLDLLRLTVFNHVQEEQLEYLFSILRLLSLGKNILTVIGVLYFKFSFKDQQIHHNPCIVS